MSRILAEVPHAALTPELALEYLDELSTDLRATVVLDGGGELLAGPPELAAAARELLAAAPDAAQIEVGLRGGSVFAARSARHAIVALAGRFALPALVRYDLCLALGDLER